MKKSRKHKTTIALCGISIWLGLSACESRSAPSAALTPAASVANSLAAPPEVAAPTGPSASGAAGTTSPSPAAPPERPSSIAAQHVLIAYRGAERAERSVKRTREAAKKLAQTVVDEAKAGADFSDLVKKYSEDPGAKERLGSLGKFTPEKMHKAFSDAAFALGVNHVSEVVETPFGFHIIKRNQ